MNCYHFKIEFKRNTAHCVPPVISPVSRLHFSAHRSSVSILEATLNVMAFKMRREEERKKGKKAKITTTVATEGAVGKAG